MRTGESGREDRDKGRSGGCAIGSRDLGHVSRRELRAGGGRSARREEDEHDAHHVFDAASASMARSFPARRNMTRNLACLVTRRGSTGRLVAKFKGKKSLRLQFAEG
jgi:hypothetical protein